MKLKSKIVVLSLLLFLAALAAPAQKKPDVEVISDRDQLKAIVPASFYFAGLSGGTQIRNSAVAKFGEKRFVISGLVDVSGYSTEISGVYEGFLITDSPIKIGDKNLELGAYGIGFAQKGELNVFDISGKKVLTVGTTKDPGMRRPRPLMMTSDVGGVRLYKGRDYVLISPN